MNSVTVKNTVLAVLAVLGGGIAQLLGGWDGALQTLVAVMAADSLTGLTVAGVFKRSSKTPAGALESRACFKGLIRKGFMLLLVFLAVLLDRAAGTAVVRPAVCMFFIANEALSILENFGLMGVPYPKFLKNMLEALRDHGDEGGEK